MFTIAIEGIGWTGAVALLTAYILISARRIDSRSFFYQFLNVVGALGFIINGWFHRAYPSVMMNVIWLLIALGFILRLVQERRRP